MVTCWRVLCVHQIVSTESPPSATSWDCLRAGACLHCILQGTWWSQGSAWTHGAIPAREGGPKLGEWHESPSFLLSVNTISCFRAGPGAQRELLFVFQSQVDIYVVCSVLKDFLRSLTETLITKSLWSVFARAAGKLISSWLSVCKIYPLVGRD